MAALGFQDGDLPELQATPPEPQPAAPVDIWPDNWPHVETFVAMSTQWRLGASGPLGLDYSALQAVLRLRGLPRSRWPETFDAIRVMEEAALEALRA